MVNIISIIIHNIGSPKYFISDKIKFKTNLPSPRVFGYDGYNIDKYIHIL